MAPKIAPKCKVWAGGIRMRMRKKLKAKGKAKVPPRSSALKKMLTDNYVTNTLSAATVQRLAEATQASGAEGLGTFNQAGSS
eukprot:7445772-Lingulodinium_polyedra.AAC.1